MTINLEEVCVTMDLSDKFSDLIRSHLTPEQMTAVVTINEINDNDTCATGDFCDSNMLMDDAWLAVMKRELDCGSEYDMALWNRAWNLSKRIKFI